MNYNNLISSSTTSSSNTAASCESTTASPDSYTKQQVLLNFPPPMIPQSENGSPQAPLIPPPSMPTAYLVQTADGNTILIQPQTIGNSHLLQQQQQQQQNNQNTLLSNRSNGYNLTIPIHYMQQQQQNNLSAAVFAQQAHNLLSNSPSINIFERPESSISNVYQTIDADK